MKTFVLYQHGGSGNHGCEALATTISREIKNMFPQDRIELISHRPTEDRIDTVDSVILHQGFKKWGIRYIIHQIDKRFLNWRVLEDLFLVAGNFKGSKQIFDYAIAIGGDNYCYSKGKVNWASDRAIKKQNTKMMLWGCSIEPNELPGELAKHLDVFDLIVARESITYNALVQNGLVHKTYLASDPAFLLEVEKLPLPDNWKEGQMVGINLSPLILNYTKNKETVVSSVEYAIKYILDNTNMNIALIPHVRHFKNDDVDVLRPFYEKYKNTNRMVLFDDISLNCKQLKGYISRCRFFVGARTHSIIAAYSTGVPAIALGYSVKAKGIAKDLLGAEEKFVIPVQTLDNPEYTVSSLKYLFENEDNIKQVYAKNLPEYIEKAKNAAQLLAELIGEE